MEGHEVQVGKGERVLREVGRGGRGWSRRDGLECGQGVWRGLCWGAVSGLVG